MSIKLTLLNFCRLVIFLVWPIFVFLTVASFLFSPATVEIWHYSQGHPLKQEKQLLNKSVFNYLVGKKRLADRFKKREKTHLKDVKALVKIVFLLKSGAFILLLLALLVFSWQKRLAALPPLFMLSGFAFASLQLILLLLALTGFASMFNIFHSLLFPPNSWLFPQRSLLIQLYPYKFWLQTALLWFSMTGLLLLGVSLVLFLKLRTRRVQKNG